jgi:hypothetical protein
MLKSLTLVASIFSLAACSGGDDPAAGAPAETPPASQIPTQQELDAQAAATIDAQNADAELEKVKQEIEGGG